MIAAVLIISTQEDCAAVLPRSELEQALVPFDLILRELRTEYTTCKQCAVWFWWEINCSQ